MSVVTGAADRSQAAKFSAAHAMMSYRAPAKVMHWITALLVLLMFGSGVIGTQIGEGAVADTLFALHKLTGVLTLLTIVLRAIYRLIRPPVSNAAPRRRLILHWMLYAVALLVPLLGWAGISDYGAREIFPDFSLPAIWPEGLGYDEILFRFHGYLAFGLLALVALHIGIAMQDYLTNDRRRVSRGGDD